MYHFFAFLARMKLIRRWALMRNTVPENDAEHSLQVAMIAHALAEIRISRFYGSVDMALLLKLAIYHETAEVITGDLPSPIKYLNPAIRDSFHHIEKLANEKLLTFLPDDLRGAFAPLLSPDENSAEFALVKAADKISAYLKCVEERAGGNEEFTNAEAKLRETVYQIPLPEVRVFLDLFSHSFALPLDGLNESTSKD
jgi:5'-deoxynucleotidase